MIIPLIRRSIRHYWRTHLGVVLGSALAALVLAGALMVGDSVKATLRAQAEARVGKIGEAFLCGERFVPWPNAVEKRPQVVARTFFPGPDAAGILLINASVTRPDGKARANKVQVVGVDKPFWNLSPISNPIKLATAANGNPEIAVNERLAAQLGVGAGDDLRMRFEKPSALSRDAPLGSENESVVMLRVKVARVVGDDNFGRFALASGQVPPHSVFVPLGVLQENLGVGEKVNVVLDAWEPDPIPPTTGIAWLWKDPTGELRDGWTRAARSDRTFKRITDNPGPAVVFRQFDLLAAELPNQSGFELRSPRIFLDEATVQAARKNETTSGEKFFRHSTISNRDQTEPPAPGLDSLTYFVNDLRLGEGSDTNAPATPYSFVTAIDAPASGFVQAELADDEIQITRWLADDLGAKPGDKITMRYFVMGERRELVEKARTFTVLAPIIEMSEPQLNSSWMPDFPNIPDKDSFSKWKPGFPFDSKRIRKKDEDYWRDHRGTPKAFVNLKVGQEMWGNRWGNLTSIRYPAGTKREQVERIAAFIDPASLGFRTVALRQQALDATNAPVDFGQLFTAFSFFLILAAAVLTGLLFTFSIEQRASEAGLLLAVGWTRRKVRRLFMREGLILALGGAVLGTAAAALYTKLVLRALAGVWGSATGGTTFIFHMSPATLAVGIVSGVISAAIAMWLASRKLFKREAAELLVGLPDDATQRRRNGDERQAEKTQPESKRWHPAKLIAWINILIVASMFAYVVFFEKLSNPVLFFLLGFGLLGAGLLLARLLLLRLARADGMNSSSDLALRNTTRRRGRSLATISVLASGVFMVVAVDSFRKDSAADTLRRDTGTGGFALIGESAAPIYEDLNTAKGRETYALDDKIMSGVRVVQMRVKDGDDASCLNLNRAIQPRVLGVNPRDLYNPHSFKFADRAIRKGTPWAALTNLRTDAQGTATAIPAVIDGNTLQWALQKKLFDKLEYSDDRGKRFEIELIDTLVASMLQGVVIIAEEHFISRFPNSSGYRFFLIDCPPGRTAEVREHLVAQLGDRGLELVPASQRLAEFNAVENTYLSIFQVLGGLGMLLGSAGLGIVVARNVLERRREFGLLEAVGYTPRQLRGLVFAEHRWLIVGALGIGAVSALVAVWPGISQKGASFPWLSVGVLFGGMAIFAALSAWLATRVSLRTSQLAALRNE